MLTGSVGGDASTCSLTQALEQLIQQLGLFLLDLKGLQGTTGENVELQSQHTPMAVLYVLVWREIDVFELVPDWILHAA